MNGTIRHTIVAILTKILALEATHILKKHHPQIIAITGSMGKTTTKDLTFHILQGKYNDTVHCAPKSFNGVLGLSLTYLLASHFSPLAVFQPFRIKKYPKVIVAEYGVDFIGDMDQQLRIVTPHVGIVTAIPPIPVHLLQFKTPENVVKEKGKLIASLPTNGFAILNFDDPRVKSLAAITKAHIIRFGKDPSYDIYATNIIEEGFTLSLDVTIQNPHLVKETTTLSLQNISLAGAFNIDCLLPAIAASLLQGVDIATIQSQCASFIPPKGRLRILEGIKDTTIIDGSYNSSPAALEESLKLLGKVTNKKRIAVLGDMRELGSYEKQAHEQVDGWIKGNADMFYSVGPLMKQYAHANIAFDNAKEAGAYLAMHLEGGEVILFKGSQNTIFLERAIQMILKNPEIANEVLARKVT